MLDLDNLPALLCKAYKLKWFDLYTSHTDAVEYAQKDSASIGEDSQIMALVTEAVIVYYNTCDQEMIQTQKRNLVINF